MTPAERWRVVRAAFHDALDVTAAERPAWLANRCGADAGLRAEVESLLAHHDEPHAIFERPIDFDADAELAHGYRIGPYRIERLLGRGGMGSVYLAARSDDAFSRDVAIKIVRDGSHRDEITRRFHIERQTLAALDHPNIATLIDAGTTDDGRPYFVMEHVDGEPIDGYCERRACSLERRLEIFLRVAAAVQHAHQRLVVHRDLKPPNILVRPDGEPRLLDFGIAKVLEPDRPDAGVTVGFRPMTPRHASPEQVRGETITTSTDIYSLGVLLYQLVAGGLPCDLDAASGPEIERAICERPPLRPSEAARQHPACARWSHRLKGDLDAVVLTALRKEPDRRYRSVERFADDVGRYLRGLPVLARPDTVRYRAAKFVGRNPLASAVAGLALVAVTGATIATASAARIARHEAANAAVERERALAEADRARRISGFLKEVLALPDPSWYSPGVGRPDMTVAQLLKATGERIDREFAAHPDIAAELHHTVGNTYRAQGFYEEAHQHLAAALDLRRRTLAPTDPKLAESLYFYGAAEFWLGRRDSAERYFRDAIEIERHLSFETATLLPYLLQDLGGVRRDRGDLDAAERFQVEAMALFRQRNGPSHITVALAEAEWAHIQRLRGDAIAARSSLEHALTMLRATPEGATQIAGVLGNLAELASSTGRAADAERLYREAVDATRAAAGDDHPLVAHYLLGLSALLDGQGRYLEAEAAARRAEIILRRRRPSTDMQLAATLAELGRVRSAAGRPREAERDLREAVAIADGGAQNDRCAAGNIKVALAIWLRGHGRSHQGQVLVRPALDDIATGCGRDSLQFRDAARAVADAGLPPPGSPKPALPKNPGQSLAQGTGLRAQGGPTIKFRP